MSSGDNSGAFLTGFLLGGLVGAAAALLITPESGEQTRIRLQQRGSDLKTRFEDVSGSLQDRRRVVIEDTVPVSAEPDGDDATEAPIESEEKGSAEEPSA